MMGKAIVLQYGDRYANWTYVRDMPSRVYKNGAQVRMIEWKCDCGTLKTVAFQTVRIGKSKSCGCMSGLILPDAGEKIGRLSFIREGDQRVSKNGKWKQRTGVWMCECGEETQIPIKSVRSGKALSCGCLRHDLSIARATTHGRAKSPLYQVWSSMKNRCQNPKCKSYPKYGGRGISVCSEWNDSFEQFVSDIGERPSSNHSLEREDSNGDYEPSNVVWATIFTQAKNRRNSSIWVINGVEYETAVKAAAENGISVHAVRNWCGKNSNGRLQRDGYSFRPRYPEVRKAASNGS